MRPPRPERGALPGCATLRLPWWRSYSRVLCGPQAGFAWHFSIVDECNRQALKAAQPVGVFSFSSKPHADCPAPSPANAIAVDDGNNPSSYRVAGRVFYRYTMCAANADIGASPSGKATAFDAVMRRFESCRPSHSPDSIARRVCFPDNHSIYQRLTAPRFR